MHVYGPGYWTILMDGASNGYESCIRCISVYMGLPWVIGIPDDIVYSKAELEYDRNLILFL